MRPAAASSAEFCSQELAAGGRIEILVRCGARFGPAAQLAARAASAIKNGLL
jgi:hypothetical protein